MNGIEILEQDYEVLGILKNINIADSFVSPLNKIGDGNGEAKLYVGQDGEKIIDFFGERGFESNCFLLKEDLIQYLDEKFNGNDNYKKIVNSSAFCSEKNNIVSDNYKITNNEKIGIIPPIGGG